MYNSQSYFHIARLMRFVVLIVMLLLILATFAFAGPGEKSPERGANEGSGPHSELILRGVNLINGEGAPMRGPVDIVVKKSA